MTSHAPNQTAFNPPLNLWRELSQGPWLDEAYHHVLAKRSPTPATRRFEAQWLLIKQRLLTQMQQGDFRLRPVHLISSEDSILEGYDCRDAILLRALSQILHHHLAPILARTCTHVKGHGGIQGTLNRVGRLLPHYAYVYRTDVKGYYGHIDHDILFDLCQRWIKDPLAMALIRQYARRRVINAQGQVKTITCGIPRGCALSPLMGALYLHDLDHQLHALRRVSQQPFLYLRYMDDIIVLCKSRWQCRRLAKCIKHGLACLRVAEHPDKTYIGPCKKGFDFLGKVFNHQRVVGLSQAAWQRFKDNLNRLYEQGADHRRLDEYIWRWRQAVSVPKMGFWVSIEGIGFRSIVDEFRAPGWRSK